MVEMALEEAKGEKVYLQQEEGKSPPRQGKEGCSHCWGISVVTLGWFLWECPYYLSPWHQASWVASIREMPMIVGSAAGISKKRKQRGRKYKREKQSIAAKWWRNYHCWSALSQGLAWCTTRST